MAKTDQPRNQEGQQSQHGSQVPVRNQGQQKQDMQQQQRGISRRGTREPSIWNMSPFSFMRRFSEDMDRLFEDFGFGSALPSTGGQISRGEFGRALWRPQVEMFQRGDDLVIRADLPGLTKDDIKVECTRDAITIEGERKQEHTEDREGYYHTERHYGQFYRAIPLPEGVKADDAKATFKDGVLEVVMKAPEESRPRKIDVQS